MSALFLTKEEMKDYYGSDYETIMAEQTEDVEFFNVNNNPEDDNFDPEDTGYDFHYDPEHNRVKMDYNYFTNNYVFKEDYENLNEEYDMLEKGYDELCKDYDRIYDKNSLMKKVFLAEGILALGYVAAKVILNFL